MINYVKERLFYFLYLVICSAVLSFLFYLYGLHQFILLYFLVISSILLILFVLIDYRKYRSTCKQLEYMKHQLINISELEDSTSYLEQQYIISIRNLYQSMQNKEQKHELNEKEMIDFYTLWVHQIKTPISALQLVLQQQNNKQGFVLQQELFKIERYVEVVLGYLRIQSMNSDFSFNKYKLENIVNDCIKKYSSQFIYKKISVETDDLDIEIATDEKWLSFVIEQLLSNALKYTNTGTIKFYAIDHVLYIEDSGIGILPQDLPRVFEKGFTGYNGRVDKKASGLGLYLCKKILDKLSYPITIRSVIDEGTIVIIELPTQIQYKD